MEPHTVNDIGDLEKNQHMYIASRINNASFSALIDCGASGYAYISEDLVRRLALPLTTLKEPIVLRGFENVESPYRIEYSIECPLDLAAAATDSAADAHTELLSAHVVPHFKYDLVLRLPWL